MRRAYKFRLYPTRRQQAALAAMLDDHRDMYNAALQERRDAYRQARVGDSPRSPAWIIRSD